jgi:[ribosomal protein S18]-alanine N-acetyltransferase
MNAAPEISIRTLAPGEEEVVRALATHEGRGDPEGLLADPRTTMLVAFDGDEPVGFVLGHELPRRHGDPSNLFVYEVDVAPTHRRRGIGKALLQRLAEVARGRGIREGFVLTDEANTAANALYASADGSVENVSVVWHFSYGED